MLDTLFCPYYLDIAKTIVSIVSTIALTIVAINGLSAWKIQLKGKTEYDLARRLLKAVYKTRDAIGIFRSLIVSSAEIATSLKEAGVETDQSEKGYHPKSQTALYQRRWKNVSAAMRDFDIEAFEAEVLWGDDIKEKIVNFRRQVGELRSYFERYVRLLNQERSDSFQEEWEKIMKVLMDMSEFMYDENENEYSKKTRQVILDIESYLQSKM